MFQIVHKIEMYIFILIHVKYEYGHLNFSCYMKSNQFRVIYVHYLRE